MTEGFETIKIETDIGEGSVQSVTSSLVIPREYADRLRGEDGEKIIDAALKAYFNEIDYNNR